jgi:dTDP-4-dehydrorhamnose 3,5-epimerase
MLSFTETTIRGVRVYTAPTDFQDLRGGYYELWNEALHGGRDRGAIPAHFVALDLSISKKGVLRGLHGDSRTSKLIMCAWGRIFLAVADWRPDSPTYKRTFTITLDKPSVQVFVPGGCVNGHYALMDCAFLYFQSQPYRGPDSQYTVGYNDPILAIPWPLEGEPILSRRDRKAAKAAEDGE